MKPVTRRWLWGIGGAVAVIALTLGWWSKRSHPAHLPSRIWVREWNGILEPGVYLDAGGESLKGACIQSFEKSKGSLSIAMTIPVVPPLSDRIKEIWRGPGDYGGSTETRLFSLTQSVEFIDGMRWRQCAEEQ